MQINYNEILLPFDILESTLSIHYTLPHTESELILFIDSNRVYSLAYTDDFIGNESREFLDITIKRSLLGRGVSDTGSEQCEIHVASEDIIFVDCAVVQNNTFSLGGNLVSVYGVWLYHDSAFFAKWDYKKARDFQETKCTHCPENSMHDGEKCVPCHTGVLLDVDHESPWWAHDMWDDIETPGVSYFPQWTNQDTQSSRGIMRYNDNNAEGNLYFTSIDTHTTDDNLLRLCQIEYTTVSFALTITEDINNNACDP